MEAAEKHLSHRGEDGLGGVVAGVARLAAVGAHIYDDCRNLVCGGRRERWAREISRGLGFSGSRRGLGEGERAYLRRTWLEIQGGREPWVGEAGNANPSSPETDGARERFLAGPRGRSQRGFASRVWAYLAAVHLTRSMVWPTCHPGMPKSGRFHLQKLLS